MSHSKIGNIPKPPVKVLDVPVCRLSIDPGIRHVHGLSVGRKFALHYILPGGAFTDESLIGGAAADRENIKLSLFNLFAENQPPKTISSRKIPMNSNSTLTKTTLSVLRVGMPSNESLRRTFTPAMPGPSIDGRRKVSVMISGFSLRDRHAHLRSHYVPGSDNNQSRSKEISLTPNSSQS